MLKKSLKKNKRARSRDRFLRPLKLTQRWIQKMSRQFSVNGVRFQIDEKIFKKHFLLADINPIFTDAHDYIIDPKHSSQMISLGIQKLIDGLTANKCYLHTPIYIGIIIEFADKYIIDPIKTVSIMFCVDRCMKSALRVGIPNHWVAYNDRYVRDFYKVFFGTIYLIWATSLILHPITTIEDIYNSYIYYDIVMFPEIIRHYNEILSCAKYVLKDGHAHDTPKAQLIRYCLEIDEICDTYDAKKQCSPFRRWVYTAILWISRLMHV